MRAAWKEDQKMTTRIVVFPVKGRKWAFSAVVQALAVERESTQTLRQLFQQLRTEEKFGKRAELATHFVAHRMHAKWSALQDAPEKSIRHRVHSTGQRLLSRLRPAESFLKAIPVDADKVEIVYPRSMNPRLVRRRLRHIALSGSVVHERLMYGSVALLPFTAILAVLPMPNLPLFWNLFRAHAHWRALQGSKRLQSLVSNGSEAATTGGSLRSGEGSLLPKQGSNFPDQHLILLPSEKLDDLLVTSRSSSEAIEDTAIESICEEYQLDLSHVLRWRDH